MIHTKKRGRIDQNMLMLEAILRNENRVFLEISKTFLLEDLTETKFTFKKEGKLFCSLSTLFQNFCKKNLILIKILRNL